MECKPCVDDFCKISLRMEALEKEAGKIDPGQVATALCHYRSELNGLHRRTELITKQVDELTADRAYNINERIAALERKLYEQHEPGYTSALIGELQADIEKLKEENQILKNDNEFLGNKLGDLESGQEKGRMLIKELEAQNKLIRQDEEYIRICHANQVKLIESLRAEIESMQSEAGEKWLQILQLQSALKRIKRLAYQSEEIHNIVEEALER